MILRSRSTPKRWISIVITAIVITSDSVSAHTYKREESTYLSDALVLDFIEGQSLLDVVQVEYLLDALLVLQDLLHAGLLQRGVAGREESNVVQATNGAHDVVPEIADGLVKLVHRSVLLLLHGEKRFLSIGYATLAAPRFYEEPSGTRHK